MNAYCESRIKCIRRRTVPVRCGPLTIGGNNPVRLQSMTTSLTQDVKSSLEQCIRLAEAGCDIVRLTAQNKQAAQALKDIRKQFTEAGFGHVALVADIHFLPSAAMEAVEHVEKVRVNPGNYADKKKFAVQEYSDTEYEAELERIHEAFSPLVKRAKALGRCMRIGTNHGSLSDRIMNRYGDTPLGMVESAMEFIRICESHGFRDIVVSMKASNPKVMIQAYRLAVARMLDEDMHYPLHLGVTEAGEGEDARIKSAIGIGALLYDGLGDTIRVSLTEDPWFELPVCRDLISRVEKLWEFSRIIQPPKSLPEDIDFYEYRKREVIELNLGGESQLGPLEPPRVIVPAARPLEFSAQILKDVDIAHAQLREARIEGLMVKLRNDADLPHLKSLADSLAGRTDFLVVDIGGSVSSSALEAFQWQTSVKWLLVRQYPPILSEDLRELVRVRFLADIEFTSSRGLMLAVDAPASTVETVAPIVSDIGDSHVVFTLSTPADNVHPVGAYRQLAQAVRTWNLRSPIWLRVTSLHQLRQEPGFGQALMEAAIFAGTHFVDGYGDMISIETVDAMHRSTALAYNILQGARMRSVKTEFVACPSCGRTLFNLQTVTQRIKDRTGHLKGVTIAVMGCIVNGPGEMADADFGYVGGAPGKINLYVGKTCVKFNIPEDEALDRLVDLIKEHDKWREPADAPVSVTAN